jgi:hypothetical protein
MVPPLFSVGILSVRLPNGPGGSVSYCNDTTAGFSRNQPAQFLPHLSLRAFFRALFPLRALAHLG